VRQLTATEMRSRRGAQTGGPDLPGCALSIPGLDPTAGPGYSWQASVGGVNTLSGNKLTNVPIVGWTAKGGLPVQLTLYHNSQSTYSRDMGQKWSHSYDLMLTVDGNTGNATMHWGNGQNYTFTKNMDGTFTAPTGVFDTLVANGTSSYDLTTKEQVKYHFTKPNNQGWVCTSISDVPGNTITLNYNTCDEVSTLVDPTTRTITLSYDIFHRLTTITDPLNRQWTVGYNGSSEVTSVTWPLLSGSTYTQQFAYDTAGHHDMVTYTDRRAHNWTFTYNTNDSIATESDPYSNQTSFTYPSGTQTVVTDANNHATTYNYDTSGRLTSTVDALTHQESYGYDGGNNRNSLTDKNGHLWQWTYDSMGNMLSATDPLNHASNWTYNAKNRLLTQTDALGHYTGNTYDATLNWNLTQTQQKTSSTGTVLSTTIFTYNPDGTVATKKDSNNHTTQYGYTTNGDLWTVTTPNSRVTTFGYNALGVMTSRKDALLRTTTYTPDNWERINHPHLSGQLPEDLAVRSGGQLHPVCGHQRHDHADLRQRQPDHQRELRRLDRLRVRL
jgi:YD repeat-containing protein